MHTDKERITELESLYEEANGWRWAIQSSMTITLLQIKDALLEKDIEEALKIIEESK